MSLLGVLRVRIVHSPIEMIKTCVDFVLDLTPLLLKHLKTAYIKKSFNRRFSQGPNSIISLGHSCILKTINKNIIFKQIRRKQFLQDASYPQILLKYTPPPTTSRHIQVPSLSMRNHHPHCLKPFPFSNSQSISVAKFNITNSNLSQSKYINANIEGIFKSGDN